jgi:ABC-2 type transport system permease protein
MSVANPVVSGATDTQPSFPRVFAKTVVARAYPRVVAANRNLSWLVMEVLFPLLGTVPMIFVYQALHAPRQYLGFVVLGGVMLAFWQNVLWNNAAQLFWDRDNGNLELFTIAPASFVAILMGMAVGAIYMTTTRAAAVIVICSVVFGVTYDLGGIAPALAIFAVTLVALYCLGMLLASLFLFYGRDVWHLTNALQEPVYFMSGFYFPVRALGAVVGGGASLVPLTLGLDAIRQLLLPGTPQFLSVQVELVILVGLVALYALLARLAIAYVERKARQEGRLIMKWA